jgi:putative endonuclease
MYYVYILKNTKTKNLYYGYTNDLKRRLKEHVRQAPWELVYYEAYKKESDARRREMGLKKYGQALTALKTRMKDSLC